MRFSVITPSFRSSRWLRLCIASVADQKVEVEHIVQDAASDDGTLEWLLKDKRAKTFVEKDEGMYDAINRGLKKSSGEICAHLNCDEQYLPGTLTAVGKFFVNHPEVEILFGDALVVDSTGGFLCHRKSILPQKPHTLVSRNLSTLTCSTFFRRSVFEKHALFFDPAWRILGDAEWLLRGIEQKIPMALLNAFTSVFTNTGDNMSLRPGAQREGETFVAAAPTWWRAAKSLIIAQHRLRKLVKGVYHQRPFDYSIYTLKSRDKRVPFHVAAPTAVWKGDLWKSSPS